MCLDKACSMFYVYMSEALWAKSVFGKLWTFCAFCVYGKKQCEPSLMLQHFNCSHSSELLIYIIAHFQAVSWMYYRSLESNNCIFWFGPKSGWTSINLIFSWGPAYFNIIAGQEKPHFVHLALEHVLTMKHLIRTGWN